MSDWKKVTLDNIAGGAGVEQFNEALDEVIANILDPNMEQEKLREIRLTVKIKPTAEERGKVMYALQVDTKLAGPRPIGSIMYMGDDKGELIAYEQNAQQGNLFDKPQETKLKHINGGAKDVEGSD